MRQQATVLILLTLQGLFCPSGGTARDAVSVLVPSGTKFPVALRKSIDGDLVKDGEPIYAETTDDIDIDGKVIIPKGSQILGQIIKSDLPANIGRNCFALYFNRMNLHNGRIEYAQMRTVDRGGVLRARRDGQEVRFCVVSRATCGGGMAGLAIGSIPEKQPFSEERLRKSTIFCGHRKQTVQLHQNDEMRLELMEDLRLLK